MLQRWLSPSARYQDTIVTPPASPLARLASDDAAALALATARDAVEGALWRLAAAQAPLQRRVMFRGAGGAVVSADAAPARVVRGFDVGDAAVAGAAVVVAAA